MLRFAPLQVTRFIPSTVQEALKRYPSLRVRLGTVLVDPQVPIGDRETRIGSILVDQIRRRISDKKLSKPAVLVVDHGTPTPIVNISREIVVEQVKKAFGEEEVASGLPARTISILASVNTVERRGPSVGTY